MLKHDGLLFHRRRFFPLGKHRIEIDHCTGGCAQRLAVPSQHRHSFRGVPNLIYATHCGGLHGMVKQPRQHGHPLTEGDLTPQIGQDKSIAPQPSRGIPYQRLSIGF